MFVHWISVFLLFQFWDFVQMPNFSLKKHNWHSTKHVFLSFFFDLNNCQKKLFLVGSVLACIHCNPPKEKRSILILISKFFSIPIRMVYCLQFYVRLGPESPFIFQQGRKKNNILNGDQANQSLKTEVLHSHVPRKIWSIQNTMWEAWPSQYSY
jgi:hypothetical protein